MLAKNTALRRKLSRSVLMPVGIAVPVRGQLIMTILILECSPHLVSHISIAPYEPRATAVGWPALPLRAALSEPASGGRARPAVYRPPCRTLAKLFLIGSAASVATICASFQSSPFCADANSRLLRLCAAERLKASEIDLVAISSAMNSNAEPVFSLEMSITFAPYSAAPLAWAE